MIFDRTCELVSRTAGTVDDGYGNLASTSGTVSVACNVQQIRRQEPGDEGEFSVTEWIGFFPTGTTIDTSDIIVHPTHGTLEVVGDPYDGTMGSDAVNHVEASLKRAS